MQTGTVGFTSPQAEEGMASLLSEAAKVQVGQYQSTQVVTGFLLVVLQQIIDFSNLFELVD